MSFYHRIKVFCFQPLVLISAGIALLWSFADLSERFVTDNISGNSRDKSLVHKEFLSRIISSEQQKDIAALYDKYRVTENNASQEKESVGLSLKEQQEQQGVLKQVFVGDLKIELKAVISQGAPAGNSPIEGKNSTVQQQLKALLLVSNAKAGTAEVQEFANNSLVHGYRLSINNNVQVSLTRTLEQGEQQITLTMYQIK
ncbi:hypothetical protein [Thalassomonas actiniarum]|uniref:Uncharacterized protein n=1 Tax=Thalassomonas actiniarum TaxID=485447 RepID=A0AAF0C559_9GAMM|nr:hypothetical protein [Thalassomonas actiniarum]WDE00525.1 hypothetical protein SG35_007785 [Thalassomonas actiniarum]